MVPRPDLVEIHDVAASDPLLLIHLKVLCTISRLCVYAYMMYTDLTLACINSNVQSTLS